MPPFFVQAESFSPQQLTTAVQDWLALQDEVTAGTQSQIKAFDSRLGYKECSEELQLSFAGPVNNQATVQIRCTSPQQWQLYISVRFSQQTEAVLSLRNIALGSMITADMLTMGQADLRLARGSLVKNPATVLGARVKRSLSAGQVVTLQDLCLVCKGDIVTISGLNNGLEVRAIGIAQMDGILGDQIQVTNRQSNRTVVAEVVAVKKVAVKF
ncbi:flagellar basal body P-ring formation chaperone FlgA [Rheinheimera sediminis]|uniref:flagellar basal body P-ring formation chaperone FlgA n=1 Tax=Rheinheimera sp. YQF-1 TaxID=2499626 RepID=UPI00164866B7|nr:flagellar basal body P-ring formation chaperone FlgA [Rheinheimera sp. YQF-1]